MEVNKQVKIIDLRSEVSLIPAEQSPKEIETSIEALHKPLAKFLEHLNLPIENVLNPIEERRKVIWQLESVLEILPIDKRSNAYYLSKFTVAIGAGLFDGALNFLWYETIRSLRRLAVNYDLQYFFSIAETVSGRYRNLTKEEELEAISEFDLLEVCRRIGLISDINHKRLEHANYMRNHASAAHPNENNVNGAEMMSLLDNCLRYAIVAVPDHSVIQIKTLFNNIKSHTINIDDFELINEELSKQPNVRINDFTHSIFGLYCDPRQEQYTRFNIENIVPMVWNLSSEETKYRIGSKFGVYRKNGENERRNYAQRFLEIVNGLQFKDEDSLAAELIEKLQDLRSTHFSFNNFYDEYPHAKSIKDSLQSSGIPQAAKRMFVRVICQCWIGNGLGYYEGVDKRAISYYDQYISLFGTTEVIHFLELFQDPEFVTDFGKTVPDSRVRVLANKLKSVTKDAHLNNGLDLIINFPKKAIDKIASDTRYKSIMKNV